MFLFFAVIAAALAIAVLIGGDVRRLSQLRLRHLELLLAAFAVKISVGLLGTNFTAPPANIISLATQAGTTPTPPSTGLNFGTVRNIAGRFVLTSIANFLQTAHFFDLGLDYDARLPDLLGAVTLDQANAAARRLLDVDSATVVVAGPYADAGASDVGARS